MVPFTTAQWVVILGLMSITFLGGVMAHESVKFFWEKYRTDNWKYRQENQIRRYWKRCDTERNIANRFANVIREICPNPIYRVMSYRSDKDAGHVVLFTRKLYDSGTASMTETIVVLVVNLTRSDNYQIELSLPQEVTGQHCVGPNKWEPITAGDHFSVSEIEGRMPKFREYLNNRYGQAKA